MEFRTNELFKNYLREQPITKTPSPKPGPVKFREALVKQEHAALTHSICRLCKMMENCELQLNASNSMMQKLFAADSDFILIQKNELKSFLNEFRQDFHHFKNEVKNDMRLIQKNVQPHQQSEHDNIFSSKKPLTPPPSFEAMLANQKLEEPNHDTHHYTHVPSYTHAFRQEKYLPNNIVKFSSQEKQLPVITYKLERHTKKRKKPLKPNHVSNSPHESLKSASTVIRMKNTQHWLESLPLPPVQEARSHNTSLNNMLASSIQFTKIKSIDKGNRNIAKSGDSDNESVSGWSCRSIRTVKSRKRGANFVNVKRVAKSEVGYQTLSPISYWGFRSEY